MTDASTPKQASEPDPEIVSSDQAQVYAPPNLGESAQLDANIAASESTHPETVIDLIATNFPSGTGDAKRAGAESIAGSDAGTQAALEKGTVHLQNRSTSSDDNIQGILPDTDPNSLPLDANADLPN